jgi:hypothetical protein
MAAMSGEVTTTPEDPVSRLDGGTHRPRHRVIRDRERQWCWATRPLVLSRTIGGAEPRTIEWCSKP